MFSSLFKLIRLAIIFLILLVAIIFAVSNRQDISLSLFPLPFEAEIPLYLFFIITLIIGYLWGWLGAGIKTVKYRHLAKKEEKKTKALTDEVTMLRTRTTTATTASAPQLPNNSPSDA